MEPSTLNFPLLYLSFSPFYLLRNQASLLYILKLFIKEYNIIITLTYLTWKLYVIQLVSKKIIKGAGT